MNLNHRPCFDVLEDRLVPATFKVTSYADLLDPGSGLLSLRGAISAANSTPELDTIKLKGGLYKINTPDSGGGNDNLNGDFDIASPVIIKGKGAGVTKLESNSGAGERARLFDVHGSIDVAFTNVTLRKAGNFNIKGGAIQALEANILLTGCGVSDCFASFGGAISAGSGKVMVVDSLVNRNVALSSGGGINSSNGTVELTNARVQNNIAFGGGGIVAMTANLMNSTVRGNRSSFSGGGIAAITANLINCNVSGNVAADVGGGVKARTATLTNSTVSGNSADNDGGGIYVEDRATLTGSTVSGNYADNGGGIWADDGTLTNSTVSGNHARVDGGGIWAVAAKLVNVTITENTAFRGGGVFREGGVISLRNTIIAQNLVVSDTGPDVFGSITSQGHNLIGNPAGSTGFGINGDVLGTVDNPLDPELGPLTDNGGPTQTHALLPSSPAIDRGDNAALDANTGLPLTTDQRGTGFSRKKDGNADGTLVIDIGAFER